MAYLRDIPKPSCQCGKPATKELVNARNAVNGSYCTKCAERAWKRLQAMEDGDD